MFHHSSTAGTKGGHSEPLLPVATAREIRYVTAVGAGELDLVDEVNCNDSGYQPALRVVEANRVQSQHPGMHAIADHESRRIEHDILIGSRVDGSNITHDEHVAAAAAKAEARRKSTDINNAIRSSTYTDNLDPLFRHQQDSPVSPGTQLSKEESLAEDERNRVKVAAKVDGYKMAEYESIYDKGGKTFYDMDHGGYKIHEYKSDYNV